MPNGRAHYDRRVHGITRIVREQVSGTKTDQRPDRIDEIAERARY